jgi:hypothetical protein
MAVAAGATFLLAAGVGCLGNDDCDPVLVQTPPELAGADTLVVVGGKSLRLDAEVWRVYGGCGSSSNDARCLAAQVRIRTTDSTAIPSDLAVPLAWVNSGTRAWQAALVEGGPDPTGMRELLARGGPKWEPGTMVDVVVRIDHPDSTVFLAARNQSVVRVE